MLVAENASRSAEGFRLVDIGACGMDFRVVVLVSLMLPVLLLTCLIVARHILANVADPDGSVLDRRQNRRMDSLCSKCLGCLIVARRFTELLQERRLRRFTYE